MLERTALCDTVIPLKVPILSSTGESIAAIPVRKGEAVSLANASYHRCASPTSRHWALTDCRMQARIALGAR